MCNFPFCPGKLLTIDNLSFLNTYTRKYLTMKVDHEGRISCEDCMFPDKRWSAQDMAKLLIYLTEACFIADVRKATQ